MSVFSSLPAWGVGILALGAGALLLFFNYSWLLAAKALLRDLRRRQASGTSTGSPESDPGPSDRLPPH